jgi:hypothetical protein
MSVPTKAALAALAGAVLVLGGCGNGSGSGTGSEEKTKAEQDFTQAADQSTCLADATAADKPWPDGFPADWPFPEQTIVYNVEDRGSSGTIATAVTARPFKDVLDYLNGDVADAGYKVESGETEEHDAEAEWEGNGYRGRWAIRESAACPGETVIQILSAQE